MYNESLLKRVKLAALAMQRYSWEQGTLAQALLEINDVETVIMLAKEAAYRQTDDGRCASIGDLHAVTDPCSVGEALIFACNETGDSMLENALTKLLHWALVGAPRNEDGIIYHLDNKKQFWVDSFYMLPPFLAKAGYYQEALKQCDGYWKALFSPQSSLLSHIWDDENKRFLRKDFWGVGNGWAAAGMARVIDLLPVAFESNRQELIVRVKLLIDGMLAHQCENGLYHDVLDDSNTFIETNAPQMTAYTIYRGVTSGYLEPAYLDIANRIRKAVIGKVDQYGLIQDVCGAPNFNAPGVAAEGQAFFILMESARCSCHENTRRSGE
jgi:unsaturated rhamnogalacturonyl hydrolase